MEQKSGGGAVGISDFRDHGTAVRSKRVEQPDGSADSATGADDTLDDAVDRARGRFHQLFPLENMYVRYGNVLAWINVPISSIIPPISSVASGCVVAGSTFISAISFLHSSI